MKTIQDVQIWDNGQVKVAKILDAHAVNVILNQNANFSYALYSIKDDGSKNIAIASGNVFMPTEEYLQWDQDEFAWDFVASALNLVITGDYVAPQPVEEIQPIIEEAPISEENA